MTSEMLYQNVKENRRLRAQKKLIKEFGGLTLSQDKKLGRILDELEGRSDQNEELIKWVAKLKKNSSLRNKLLGVLIDSRIRRSDSKEKIFSSLVQLNGTSEKEEAQGRNLPKGEIRPLPNKNFKK